MEYIANWGYMVPECECNKEQEEMITKKLITILFIFKVIYSVIGLIWGKLKVKVNGRIYFVWNMSIGLFTCADLCRNLSKWSTIGCTQWDRQYNY